MKNIYDIILANAIFIISLLLFTQCKKTAANQYVDYVKKICPLVIDDKTTLENINILNNNTLCLNFMTTISDANSFEAAKEELLYTWVNEPAFKPLCDEKVTGIYQYYDKETKLFVYEIKITPDIYLNYKLETHAYNFLKATTDRIKSRLTFPTRMDENGLLFELNVREPAILEYKIQVVDIDKNELDTVKMKQNETHLVDKSDLLNQIKRDNFEMMRNFKTTFNYLFFDKNNNYMGTVSIYPEDYCNF